MEKEAKKFYTIAEYLAMEEVAEFRSEYYQGDIYAISGASVNHNRIVRDTLVHISNALRQKKGCEAFANDMKIWFQRQNMFFYPDISLVCGNPEFYEDRDDAIVNPLVIIEVLSQSTAGFDRGKKFEAYRTIDTLQDYILVDQYRPFVEHFARQPQGGWLLYEKNDLAEVLTISGIDISLPLSVIYESVDFSANE